MSFFGGVLDLEAFLPGMLQAEGAERFAVLFGSGALCFLSRTRSHKRGCPVMPSSWRIGLNPGDVETWRRFGGAERAAFGMRAPHLLIIRVRIAIPLSHGIALAASGLGVYFLYCNTPLIM